jgi:sulfur-oxidizing protein SoxB
VDRREFIRLLGIATLTGVLPIPGCASRRPVSAPSYDVPPFGNMRLLHITDTHGQLLPVHHRESSDWLTVEGVHAPRGLTGAALLEYYDIPPDGPEGHALTDLDYLDAARNYGRVGGYAHLRTLVLQLREAFGTANTLLLDGGDAWQGSATALWTEGADMVGASNLLGVDAMVGHWEFTVPVAVLRKNVDAFSGAFIAQNVTQRLPALPDVIGNRLFAPYVIRELGGRRVAVVGQAFPNLHRANSPDATRDWRFEFDLPQLQTLVGTLRDDERVDAVVLLSHSGIDIDLYMASRISGLDVILGGHSHNALPQPIVVGNPGGQTLVTAGGCNGKFVGVLDLDVAEGRLRDFRYRLLPVFANYLPADPDMADYIERVRQPFADRLSEPLAHCDTLVCTRGALGSPWGWLIAEALRQAGDAEIGESTGYRWGTTVLPGETITMETLLAQTAMTYPGTYTNTIEGALVQLWLEEDCDKMLSQTIKRNHANDVVRMSGITYACDPAADFPNRFSDLRMTDGRALDPRRNYKVAGWGPRRWIAPGPPVWEIVANYLRTAGTSELKGWRPPRVI